MSGVQFHLGSSRAAIVQSDPPGIVAQADPKPVPKNAANRPRSLSSPLRKSALISLSNESLSIVEAAASPTFLINLTESEHPPKTLKARRRYSENNHTDKKIISLKKDVTPGPDKKNKHNALINFKKDIKTDEIKAKRRLDSKLGNDSHSPRLDIYGRAKELFAELVTIAPGSYLLLKLGKEIESYLPLISDKIESVKEVSIDLANDMKLFIHHVQSDQTYKQYKKALKVIEGGLKEEKTENLFGKLQQKCVAYEYEIHTQILLQRALDELQLNSTSPRNLKKIAFLTKLCEKLELLHQDYFLKFPAGFQELFRSFYDEAKKQLGTNIPRKHEQPLLISDQRSHKIETASAMNSSTAAITYMLSICECEAMRVHAAEAGKLLIDLEHKAVPGNFLRLKIGKEIDRNREIFKNWMLEPFHPLSFDALSAMTAFYDSISTNKAYEMYVMHFNQKQKINREQPVKEIGKRLIALNEEIKNAKKASQICNDLSPNDISAKKDCLHKLSKYYGILEIMIEVILEKAISECEEISKVKLPNTDRFLNFITNIKYKIDNFSKYIDRFPIGYIDLLNRLKKAITELEHSQQIQKIVTAVDDNRFSTKALNLILKIFEEDLLQLHQEDTFWVLKNLHLLESILQDLHMRKAREFTLKYSPGPTTNEVIIPSPEKDEKLLLLINKKLEKAKKFARLQQLRGEILNLIKDSEWTQNYLFKSNDPHLLNLREHALGLSHTSTHEMLTLPRSRTRKRFHSREDTSILDKSSSPRLEKSSSPPPRSKKTLTRSTSSASIEDTLTIKARINTSNPSEQNRPKVSLSDSTTSDSQSPRIIDRSLSRTKSCKSHSSSPRKISASPRVDDAKKNQEEINQEFVNLLIAPGVDNALQRNLIASYATFFKPITDDPPLVELLKTLHKRFLEEGPYQKQEILAVLRELLCNPVITLIHSKTITPLILEIITHAKSKSNLLEPYIKVVETLILTSDKRKLSAPKFYSSQEYAQQYEITNILPKSEEKLESKKESVKNSLDVIYENNVHAYSQSLKRINLFDYIQIDSTELKTANFSIPAQCPHISALANRFTQLSDWVLESIFLRCDKADSAVICRMIEFFIDVTDNLLDNISKNESNDSLRKAITPDYLSALAIFVSLQKPFIEELFIRPLKKKKLEINKRHTGDITSKPKINISEKHLKKYLLFKEYLKPNENFQDLREKIKIDLHCIPPILLTTKDVDFAFEKNQAIINNKINLRCVEHLGNLLYTMAIHQKHLIQMYLKLQQGTVFENTVIDFDRLFQPMLLNQKYHTKDAFDNYNFDSDLLDTICRAKVKEIFPRNNLANISPRKEETKIRFET